jgi:hypothetical protein
MGLIVFCIDILIRGKGRKEEGKREEREKGRKGGRRKEKEGREKNLPPFRP